MTIGDHPDDLPDLRAVGITYDADTDAFNIDMGDEVGDFEALGLLLVALARQFSVCIGTTFEFEGDDD